MSTTRASTLCGSRRCYICFLWHFWLLGTVLRPFFAYGEFESCVAQTSDTSSDDMKRSCSVCNAKAVAVVERVSLPSSELANLKSLVPIKKRVAGGVTARLIGFAVLRCRGCGGVHVPSVDSALVAVDSATMVGVSWGQPVALQDARPHWRRVLQHAMVSGQQFEQPCPATLALDPSESFIDVVCYAMTYDEISAACSRVSKTPATKVLSPSVAVEFGSAVSSKAGSGGGSGGTLPAVFDATAHSSNVELSEGDTVAKSTSSTNCYASGSIGFTSGVAEWTFKISKDSMNDECSCVGFCTRPVEGESYDSSKQLSMIRAYNGGVYAAGSYKTTVRKLHQDEMLAFRLDMAERTVSLKVNDEDIGVVFSGIEGDEIFPAVAFYSSDRAVSFVDLRGTSRKAGSKAGTGVAVATSSPAHFLKIFVLHALHSAVVTFGADVAVTLVRRGIVRNLLDFVDAAADDPVPTPALAPPKSWEDVDVSAVAPARLAAAVLLRVLDVAIFKAAVEADVGSQMDMLRLIGDCEKLAAVCGADVESTKNALLQGGAIQAVLTMKLPVLLAGDVASVMNPVVLSALRGAVVCALARLLSWVDSDPRLASVPVTHWFAGANSDSLSIMTDLALVGLDAAPRDGVSIDEWAVREAASKRCSLFCASLLQQFTVSRDAVPNAVFDGGFVSRWSEYVLGDISRTNPEVRCAIASAILQLFDASVLLSSVSAVLRMTALDAVVLKRFVEMASICASLDEFSSLAEIGMRSAVTTLTQEALDSTKSNLLHSGAVDALLRVYRKLVTTAADEAGAVSAAVRALSAALAWFPGGAAWSSLVAGALPGDAGADAPWSVEEWCSTLVRLSLVPSSSSSRFSPAFEAGSGYTLSADGKEFTNESGNIAIAAGQGISEGIVSWTMRLIADTNASGVPLSRARFVKSSHVCCAECTCFGIIEKPIASHSYDSNPGARLFRSYNGYRYDKGVQTGTVSKTLHPGNVIGFTYNAAAGELSMSIEGEDLVCAAACRRWCHAVSSALLFDAGCTMDGY